MVFAALTGRIPRPVSGPDMTIHVGDAGPPLVPSAWWVMGVMLCVRPGDYGTVVAVSGEIDVCLEGPLQQVLLQIMCERGARLLLDLSGVSFMDCTGLRAVLATRRRAELRGGFLRLTAVSAAVGRIIDLTGTREAFGCGTEQHGSFGPNSSKPNGPDTTRRRKYDAAQVFRISAERH
jgi:anti-sigma B factor antagonist